MNGTIRFFLGVILGMFFAAGLSQAVLVDGYCYLEGQTNHAGTMVLFEENSPGAVTDSTLTDNTGYYQIDLTSGAYDVFFSHEAYYYDYILDQLFFSPTTLPDVTLNAYPAGVFISGPLSGTLEDTIYVVTGPISVEAGQLLTISTGATLLFWDFYEYPSFNIYGTLFAEGTEQDSITFTAAEDAYWGGIDFLTTVSGNSRLEHCEISGSNGSGIYCFNASPSIRHCLINRNSADNGGGIDCYLSNPTISHCTIKGNTAGNGGGIECWQSSPTIEYCLIDDNSAWDDWGGGGGIFCRDNALPTIEYCTITENSAPDGGGIRFMEAGGIVDDCTITGNYCWYEGGAMFIGYSSPTISNCQIEGNTTGQDRGGICIMQNSNPMIRDCTISDNQGQGIYTYSYAMIENCTITGNLDGGIFGWCTMSECTIRDNGGTGISTSGTVTGCVISGNNGYGINGEGDYHNCLIYDNLNHGIYCPGDAFIEACTTVGNGANGIYIYSASPTILNSAVSNNIGAGIGGEYPGAEITYSDFFNNGGGNITGNPPQWLGQIVTVNANGDSCDLYFNIFEDPEFIDTFWDDYRLRWGSPCIDAGDSDPTYNDPDGTVADMGAFYYDQSLPVSIFLTPFNMPIQIPAGGGSFEYNLLATNIDPASQLVSAWVDVTLPNGSVYGPVMGPVSVTLDPGQTAARLRTQVVPAGAPEGLYSYNAYAVAGSDTSMDSFPFEKLGSDGSDEMTGWLNTGESFEASSASDAGVPKNYSLDQNYPNPFNPTTTIGFALPEASKVLLSVYDVTGRLEVTLVDGYRNAGIHEVTFDATDLASGIYFYRLEAGQFTGSGKLVLMK